MCHYAISLLWGAILNPYDFNKLFENDDQLFNSGDSQSEQGSTSAILDDGEEEGGNVPILVNDGDGPLDESSLLNAGEEEPNTLVVVNEERSQKKLSRRKSTIDEEREQFTDYTYPPLIDPWTDHGWDLLET